MFIFLTTDGFSKVASNISPGGEGLGDEAPPIGNNDVRRPYRGVEIKQDTYAALSIRDSKGTPIGLTSSSARPTEGNAQEGKGVVNDYSDFILQSVTEERSEKSQIIETFGDTFVYFFGERPRILNIRGLLMNTFDFNWRSQFWRNYDRHLRGSKLVEKNARAYLAYDTRVLEGYPLSASANDVADQPYSIQFSMSMLITNFYDYSDIGTTSTRNQAVDVAEVNAELEQRRAEFTSTTAAVRSRNLFAQPDGGLFGALRSGIRAVNEVTSLVGSGFDQINSVIGGRVVRMPIGIAGFLASTGSASFAGGSVDPLISDYFDARTGELETVTGSVKVRLPKYAVYSPLGNWKGFYWENYDENPFGDSTWGDGQAPGLEEAADPKTIAAFKEARAARLANQVAVDKRLGAWNAQAEAGAFLNKVAEVVKFTKSAVGMAMTAKAFVENPAAVTRQWLGIPSSFLPSPKEYGVKKSASTQSRLHVGYSVEDTLDDLSQELSEETAAELEAGGDGGPAEIGDVYERAGYKPTASSVERREELLADEADTDYESVYGDRDYSSLVAADPGAKASLDEVYGNNDQAPEGSDLNPQVFDEVYGLAAGQTTSSDTDEMLEEVTAQQSPTKVSRDENVEGIRGAAEDDAQIDPVI